MDKIKLNRRQRRAIQATQRRLKRKAQREMLRLMRMMDENPELAALVAEELDSNTPSQDRNGYTDSLDTPLVLVGPPVGSQELTINPLPPLRSAVTVCSWCGYPYQSLDCQRSHP